jgi:AraC-like DNA-binding protein
MTTCGRNTRRERLDGKSVKIDKMAAVLTEICNKLSMLSNDLSSVVFSHGEIDFYIYRLEQLWKILFQIYYDSSAENNTFDDGSILLHIRDAIMCLNECNRVLYLLYRCPVQYSGGAGRPKLAITKNQLEYLIDNDLSAKDISSMLNISVRTVHHRFQEFELSIRASYVIW